jgi:hypothetical protein
VNTFQIAPGFLDGVSKLHNSLEDVTLVLAFCGLMIVVIPALRTHNVSSIIGALIRMAIAVVLLGLLGTWGDLLNDAVTGLMADLGWGATFPGGLATEYRNALLRRFGSDSVQAGQSSGAQLERTQGGVKITHYGYEKPGDPNYDSKSAQGIGAFDFDSAPGSLQAIGAGRAAALSPDVAALYHVQPQQSFNLQLEGGEQMTLVYADKTDPSLTGRVDIYDPENQYAAIDGAAVTAFAENPVTQQSGGGFNVFDPIGSIRGALTEAAVKVLSFIALVCMVLMAIAQQIVFHVEVAISPIFIGFLCIPGLSNLATRFFTTLASVCLWPLGWIVSGLITKLMLDIAVNSGGNSGLSGITNTMALGSGGLFVWGWWFAIALWVIGSSIFAPVIVSSMIITNGSSGISNVLKRTLGAAALMAAASAYRGAAAGVATVGGGGSILLGAGSRSARENFARRPTRSSEKS